MEEPSTSGRTISYCIGAIAIAISWFANFSYLEIKETNGFAVECSGFDVVAIACGITAIICSFTARSIILAIGGISGIAIGFNFNDALCPEIVSPYQFRNFP